MNDFASAPAPLVSCLMVTGDRPEFVAQAIRLFQRQTYPCRELLIVGEAPPPAVPQAADTPLRFVPTAPGLSIGAKRNLGCRFAAGEFVLHWDDDDWHGPRRIAAQLGPMLADEADFTGLTNTTFFDLRRWQFWTVTPEHYRRMFLYGMHGGTIAYRRRLWQAGPRFPDSSLGEDAAFIRSNAAAGARLRTIAGEGLFLYVRHGDNAWDLRCGAHGGPAHWSPASPQLEPQDRQFYERMHRRLSAAGGGQADVSPVVPSGPHGAGSTAAAAPPAARPPQPAGSSAEETDCLGRFSIRGGIRPSPRDCVATAVTAENLPMAEAMLRSLEANGECPQAQRVLLVDKMSGGILELAGRFRATVIRCRPSTSTKFSLQSAIYSAARLVAAERLLCVAAETLVLGSLRPLLEAVDAAPSGAVLIARDAGRQAETVGDAFAACCGGDPRQVSLLSPAERDFSPPIDDGVFAARRDALLRLDAAIRGTDARLRAWADAAPDRRREQLLCSLALARLGSAVAIDPAFNIQLRGQQHVERLGRWGARWQDRLARVLNFRGAESRWPQWQDAAPPRPLVERDEAAPLEQVRRAALRWIARSEGHEPLRMSMYGEVDGFGAVCYDPQELGLYATLSRLVRSNGCRRVLETGTCRGLGTSYLAAAVCGRHDARVVTIDCSPQPQREALWSELPPQVRRLIDARSGDSLAEMQRLRQAGASFEAAFLDSDHSLQHVTAEFRLATELVCEGGLILLHDILLPGAGVGRCVDLIQRQGFPVARLWTAADGSQADQGLGLAVVENRRRPPQTR